LGASVGSTPFAESVVAKTLHEDLGMIFNFPMLVDFQTAFAMFLLCYAQCLGYLLRIMFPSLDILQHYVEFNIHTIITLEKLLGAGSFGGSINHLTCHQPLFLLLWAGLASLMWFGLLPPHFCGVGHSLLLHLSLVSNRMIAFFF